MLMIVVLAVLVAGVAIAVRRTTAPKGPQLAVTASFYPMAEFARQVGGDKITVTTLVKPGLEPHDYDPSPRDVAAIYNSKVLVYNGAGLEKWEGKLDADLRQHGVITVDASNGLTLKPAQTDSSEGAFDPHVWMAPQLAIPEVTNIKEALIQADPANQATYEANARGYIKQLQVLDGKFKKGLAACTSRSIVTSHQAFAYLTADYNLNALSISGLSPDDEPSPQKLAQVANFVHQNDVHYIFFEALVSPKLSQTIANETGAQTIAFNPLEGLTNAQLNSGQNYLTVQESNLQALRTALDCR